MEAFTGEIILVAFGFAPVGWAICAGQLLPINEHQALFSLLGTRYGGDGISNFRLPNISAPTNMNYIICIYGWYPSRS
jgi:microcystin-dependent protein